MDACDSLSLFTPVATFKGDFYNPLGDVAGIFVGCLHTGFEVSLKITSLNTTACQKYICADAFVPKKV